LKAPKVEEKDKIFMQLQTNLMDILEEKQLTPEQIARLATALMGRSQEKIDGDDNQIIGFNNITYEKIITQQAREIKYFIIDSNRNHMELAENLDQRKRDKKFKRFNGKTSTTNYRISKHAI
jgi:hypothetical protein